MDSEWKQFTLSKLCHLITDGKHGDCENQEDSGFYFLSVKDVFGNRLNYEQARQITEKDFLETHKRTNLEPGDVLFTNTGTIGRMAIAPEDSKTYRTTFQKSVAILKPNRDFITPRFFYYLLSYDNARLSNFAGGTTQKNLLLKDFRNFPVRIPSLPIQQAIAHILGTLDDKIELNQQMNQTLEAIARALFKSWFIDFDPVRAKLDGRQPIGMDAETAALFPAEFEDSAIGKIPKGWTYQAADTIADVGIGKTPPRKEHKWFSMNPKDIRWASIRDMGESGTFISKTKEYLISDSLSQFNIRTVPDNTVILSFKLTIGRVALTDGEIATNEAIAHFSLPSTTSFSSVYLYLYLEAFDYNRLGNTSSIAQAVNSKIIKAMPILNPGTKMLESFTRQVLNIFEKIKQTQRESEALSSIRDALLPKLLSGEIRVQDAEKLVEAVT